MVCGHETTVYDAVSARAGSNSDASLLNTDTLSSGLNW